MGRFSLYAIGLLVGLTGVAGAQTWPGKQPIRTVVPFTAGSATDIMARAVLDEVGRAIGQTFVIENRVGAGGTIGAAAVAKAEPDGYTILVHSSSHTITPSTYPNLSYDAVRDLPAVIPLGNLPNVLVVPPNKYQTIQELVAVAKAKPGSLTYGSAGLGGAAHLNAERFRLSAGFEAVHVPFKGGPETLREIIADRIDFYFSPALPALPLVREGQVRALAVSTSKRALALPDLPTTIEAGYPNSDYNFWIGVFTTGGTPREIINRLHGEIAKALEVPVIRDRMAKLGAEPMPMTPEQFDAYVKAEVESNAALVRAVGIRAY
jgi:tripartite-type tricarboxylate transporter receptor subunit TctC